jgi:hypothetical protein
MKLGDILVFDLLKVNYHRLKPPKAREQIQTQTAFKISLKA